MADLAAVFPLCDALEWLLAPRGHRHVGAVTVAYAPLDDGLVWGNKRPGVLCVDGPEAELRLEVHPDGAPVYTIGGSPEWVLGAGGPLAVRLCRAIVARGYAVVEVGVDGVLVAEVRRG